MSKDGKEIVRILKDDYGIFNEEQLNSILRRLGGLDISIFCKMKDEGGNAYDAYAD